METSDWFKGSLVDSLTNKPYLFNFFQATRLVDMGYINNSQHASMNTASLGSNTLPFRESMRLQSTISLSFQTADVYKFVPSVFNEDTHLYMQPVLTTTIFGLAGVSGPLPQYYTDVMLVQKRLGNNAMADFLEMFDHRLLSLYYRGWAKQRIYMSYERQQQNPNQQDQHAFMLKSLHGNALTSEQDKVLLNHVSVFYAGLLAQQPRSASGLERLLTSYLSLPLTIRQFEEEWLFIPRQEWTIISNKNHYNQLGHSILLGKKVKSTRDAFTLVIGPINYKTFQQLKKETTFLNNLHILISYYCNNNIKYKINVGLQKNEVPRCRLNATFQLGLDMWLISKQPSQNKYDTYIKNSASTVLHLSSAFSESAMNPSHSGRPLCV